MNAAAPEAKHHPIVRRAIAGLRKGQGQGQPIQLSPVIAERLREDMRALFDKPELKVAVEDLVQFAFFLEDTQHAREAAQALLGIASEATGALRAQAKRFAERADQVRAATARSAGADRGGPLLPHPPRGASASLRKH